MRITHQDPLILSHSRAIGAPKREVSRFTGYELCKPCDEGSSGHTTCSLAKELGVKARRVMSALSDDVTLNQFLTAEQVMRARRSVAGETNAAAQPAKDTGHAQPAVVAAGAAAPPFKVGDRVVCVDNDAVEPFIAVGSEHTVEATSCDGMNIWLADDTHSNVAWQSKRFRLATQRPFAIWRRLSDVPVEERGGLWHMAHIDPTAPIPACEYDKYPASWWSDNDYVVLRCAPGVMPGDAYRPELYVQPDADGFFAHEPKPDSVCPVPVWVKRVAVRFRDGSADWRVPSNGRLCGADITAWRPLP